MALPFSVCDLIKVIDITVRLCKSFKNAPEEFQNLLESLEFSARLIAEIGKVKADSIRRADYNESWLDEECRKYQTTLKELASPIEEYKRVNGSTWGKIIWVVGDKFKKYQTQISDHERRIALALLV